MNPILAALKFIIEKEECSCFNVQCKRCEIVQSLNCYDAEMEEEQANANDSN